MTKKRPGLVKNFLKRLRAYDYRQAAEKILFTTIGLLLAFWINTWDDRHKKYHIETETLRELHNGLEQDLGDMSETITGYEYRVKGCAVVLQTLSEQGPAPDTFNQYLQYINGYSFLLANTAAYESLKSRGMETIGNDSLRLAIITLYDVDYQRVRRLENALMDVYLSQLVPYFLHNTRHTATGVEPLDLAALRRDNFFRQMLYDLQTNNSQLESEYQRLKERAARLQGMINQELQER